MRGFFTSRGRWALGRRLTGLAVGGVVVCGAGGVRARDSGELARIDRELKEQRELLQQAIRNEQEHHEAIRRLLEKQQGAAAPAPAASDGAGAGATDVEATPAQELVARPAPMVLARVTGHVTAQGAALQDVYVYLEGYRSNAGRNASLEISQVGKQFEPRFAVALPGTRASFPNRDTFFHNVFSPTPVPFDLGTYRANEETPSVVLKTPGVVEIFCNIHAQMSAQILVVPNRVFAKVEQDGSFHLDKVPVGRRKLVAWGPGLRARRLDVTVPNGGTDVTIALEPTLEVRHKNKFGQPYGSYKE